MNLSGKTALVTGAARGIGRGCAVELARAGADVYVNDRERTAEAEQVLGEIRALGRDGEIVEGDAFDAASCERIVERTIAAAGRIDVLVSNPAYSVPRRLPRLRARDVRAGLRGTLTGGFHMSQLVARHMVERGGGGKIVFISSVHAEIPYARSVAYNAGKAGLKHMAKTDRQRTGRTGSTST